MIVKEIVLWQFIDNDINSLSKRYSKINVIADYVLFYLHVLCFGYFNIIIQWAAIFLHFYAVLLLSQPLNLLSTLPPTIGSASMRYYVVFE